MWPIIMAFLRSRAPYITLPFAAVVGVIGYNLENLLSDKYTPYKESIQEQRIERLAESEIVTNPTNVESLKYNADVLGKNLSPSLKEEAKYPVKK